MKGRALLNAMSWRIDHHAVSLVGETYKNIETAEKRAAFRAYIDESEEQDLFLPTIAIGSLCPFALLAAVDLNTLGMASVAGLTSAVTYKWIVVKRQYNAVRREIKKHD